MSDDIRPRLIYLEQVAIQAQQYHEARYAAATARHRAEAGLVVLLLEELKPVLPALMYFPVMKRYLERGKRVTELGALGAICLTEYADTADPDVDTYAGMPDLETLQLHGEQRHVFFDQEEKFWSFIYRPLDEPGSWMVTQEPLPVHELGRWIDFKDVVYSLTKKFEQQCRGKGPKLIGAHERARERLHAIGVLLRHP